MTPPYKHTKGLVEFQYNPTDLRQGPLDKLSTRVRKVYIFTSGPTHISILVVTDKSLRTHPLHAHTSKCRQ